VWWHHYFSGNIGRKLPHYAGLSTRARQDSNLPPAVRVSCKAPNAQSHRKTAPLYSAHLRRLMSNCGPQGRSRDFMLVPNLLPKMVPHSGSRLLPRFIVRIRGRLVASKPRLDPAPTRSPSPSRRLGGTDPGDPRPVVAALSQREGLLVLRRGAPARLLPEPVLPEPAQPQGTGPGARVARVGGGVGGGPFRPFGRLPRPGHDPHPCDREGEDISQE
jgi:hypothetical protein